MESLKSAQVKRNFFEDNTDYTEINASEIGGTKGFQIDEDEEEVWLLQCPKGLDVQKLEGNKLKFPGRAKIKEFEATALELTTPKTVAFGYSRKQNYQLRLLPIAGKIVLREQLTAPTSITEESLLEACPPTSVPMPEYIKVRHPLLGADYDEHLKLSTKRKSRISDEIMKRPIKQESSPKKRNHSIANENSGKKSKSAQRGKKQKVESKSFDVSEDLKWIKEL